MDELLTKSPALRAVRTRFHHPSEKYGMRMRAAGLRHAPCVFRSANLHAEKWRAISSRCMSASKQSHIYMEFASSNVTVIKFTVASRRQAVSVTVLDPWCLRSLRVY